MSRITRVEAIPFAIPLKKPVRWGAAGIMRRLEHVLVRLTTESGAVGLGEAAPRPTIYGESLVSVVHAIEEWYGPAMQGLDVSAPERVWQAFASVPANPTAKGALDMALYDAAAREAGVALVDYLGGFRAPVPVSYMLGLGGAGETVEEALGIRARTGITAFKIKAGQDAARDVEVVAALRRELGPEAVLYVDANQLYTPHQAERVITAMAEHGLAWAEEPVAVERMPERRRLAARLPVPILVDDSASTLAHAAHQVAEGIAGMICIKIARTGMHQSRKIVGMAEAFGVPCLVGSQGLTDLGTVLSAHFAAAFAGIVPPADLGNFIKQESFILRQVPELREGRLELAPGTGAGVEVDDALLDRLRL